MTLNKQSLLFVLITMFTLLAIDVKAQSQTDVKQSIDSSLKDKQHTQITSESIIFETAEVAPSVDMKAWRRHVETQLLPYIVDAAKAYMRPGKYTVVVRFLVETDGTVSNVKALNDPGYGLAKGSETVVMTGPKWKPAEQNGKKVRCFHMQPIQFYIQ